MMMMILIVAIATTMAFYSRLEVRLQKKIRGIRSVFAWANLVGMNVGGAAVHACNDIYGPGWLGCA
jgi:hypothetical protein